MPGANWVKHGETIELTRAALFLLATGESADSDCRLIGLPPFVSAASFEFRTPNAFDFAPAAKCVALFKLARCNTYISECGPNCGRIMAGH
jgi:hypothetical protein